MRKVTAIMVSTIMIATLFTCAISTFAQSTYNALNAEIDLKPDHLNLKSRGKWVTGYIELPSGYEPAEIDISTIKLKLILENPFQLPSIPVERQEVVIGDYDNDGISDLMVKFLRIKLGELIYSDSFVTKQVQSGAYNIQVSGQLTQGISFKGYDNFALTFRIPTGLGVHITEVGHRQPQGACTVYAEANLYSDRTGVPIPNEPIRFQARLKSNDDIISTYGPVYTNNQGWVFANIWINYNAYHGVRIYVYAYYDGDWHYAPTNDYSQTVTG